ncbi:hypothetical protein Droror1_Dr00019977 [Drosera rotundifolia]
MHVGGPLLFHFRIRFILFISSPKFHVFLFQKEKEKRRTLFSSNPIYPRVFIDKLTIQQYRFPHSNQTYLSFNVFTCAILFSHFWPPFRYLQGNELTGKIPEVLELMQALAVL